ncbi:MAG: flagellar protein export ATPase FliI [Aminobacterium sp.]|uniref:flagellar protein export ATPase FliI n=1 Tax=Aminobacterium sp. TaxID=1872491 RepID=UPI001BCD3274|nr:flagellar protein export ATPase FliI [Aminobacterium sp.]MDD2207065.1 flagellar protein export ATPase FliI [Aminobacterium sp.]MDD3425593.1 flagellar protein export ATPase FliI [Aminobacterium sp.]MDD3707426.1 flagellar protein export ATPase FliI [Aminobacterium sp.]MDD4228768.1 flagellar protein export ATPase FliI [Aminobacterium sp.]MDD4550613.1 flagellar protein export ATPase FliI [Aminobacterium sp.]
MNSEKSRELLWDVLEARLSRNQLIKINGRVVQVVGLVVESQGPDVRVGDLCQIRFRGDSPPLKAEVVGFREDRVLLMPLGSLKDVGPGCDVVSMERPLGVHVGRNLLGRVLDGLGQPMDDKGPIIASDFYPLYADPPHPLRRQMISSHLSVGVKAIDGILTLGTGQRIGIFAGSGVGKSTLLGMMARNTEADINVIALVGERGREVREFIDHDLGAQGMERSVLVVATSDQPPLIRLKAALTATAIAEYFRDQGKNVLLMMDSVTRVARAQREVGLAIGEPPTTRGYTPSVFEALPRLLERAGAGERGSITGIYTVLVEGDDMNEPVADTVRGILDGHVVLSRKIASKNFYPAIDILNSVSRVMPSVVSKEHLKAVSRIREAIAVHREAEDLVNIGAYKEGSNRKIDWALSHIEDIHAFLCQSTDEKYTFEETESSLMTLAPFAEDI